MLSPIKLDEIAYNLETGKQVAQQDVRDLYVEHIKLRHQAEHQGFADSDDDEDIPSDREVEVEPYPGMPRL